MRPQWCLAHQYECWISHKYLYMFVNTWGDFHQLIIRNIFRLANDSSERYRVAKFSQVCSKGEISQNFFSGGGGLPSFVIVIVIYHLTNSDWQIGKRLTRRSSHGKVRPSSVEEVPVFLGESVRCTDNYNALIIIIKLIMILWKNLTENTMKEAKSQNACIS